MYKAPGKAKRTGITLMQLADMFPDEETAMRWFEDRLWPNGRHCPRCKGTRTCEASHKKMPYWCSDCRQYFSVKIGTVMQSSKLSYRKWVYAIYLHITSLKGVSSMKLHRDIGVRQDTAWHLLQRIRKAFDRNDDDLFGGPIEVDETYVGGIETNKHEHKKLHAGRGTVGKVAVVGAKDRATGRIRAEVVEKTDAETLQNFVLDQAIFGTTVYTDDNKAYSGLRYIYDHSTVKHSVAEYVRGMVHTNGIESFWATLKRAHKGVYHKMSKKHLHRYVADFAGRHGLRNLNTLEQMTAIAQGFVGKRLRYRTLVA
jgi:transposase-like protein